MKTEKTRMEPYKRSKFQFDEAYEDLDKGIDNPLDIIVKPSSSVESALSTIKKNLDAERSEPKPIYVADEYIGKIEAMADGRYHIHDIDRRLIGDILNLKFSKTSVYEWSGLSEFISRAVAQKLDAVESKIGFVKVGDWMERGPERKRIESISKTASGSFFLRFDDASIAYIDSDDDVDVVGS